MRIRCSTLPGLAAVLLAACGAPAPPKATEAAAVPAPKPPSAAAPARPAPAPDAASAQRAAPARAAPKPPAAPAAAPPSRTASSAPGASAARASPAAAGGSLDLKSLEQRLRATNAIGALTKLSLKNQVDDLVGRFKAFHQGQRPPTLGELRPSFDLLLMKVLSLLQDKDAALARDIDASREAIWAVLTDRNKLAQSG